MFDKMSFNRLQDLIELHIKNSLTALFLCVLFTEAYLRVWTWKNCHSLYRDASVWLEKQCSTWLQPCLYWEEQTAFTFPDFLWLPGCLCPHILLSASVEGVRPAWVSLYPGSRHPKYKMRNNRWLQTDGGT